MPIRPENRARYPQNWDQLSLAIRNIAEWKCEFCGVPHGALVIRDDEGHHHAPKLKGGLTCAYPQPGEQGIYLHPRYGYRSGRVIKIVLTVAHLDHKPENCSADNLRALCQRCHLRHDAHQHARTRRENRKRALAVRDLFDERNVPCQCTCQEVDAGGMVAFEVGGCPAHEPGR